MRTHARSLVTVLLALGCAESASRPSGDAGPGEPLELPLVLVLPGNSGSGQAAPVASYLADPLVVRVMRGGNPVPGIVVRWASVNPTARVEPSREESDENGYVSARFFTATTSGDQNAIAILGNQWLGIRVRALPGAPSRLRPVSHLSDSVIINTPLYLRVKVEDQFGNGVPGVGPEWSMPWQANVGLDQSGRPSDAGGIAYSSVLFTTGPRSAVVTARLPSFPMVAPVIFLAQSY